MIKHFKIHEVCDYINWIYFFHAWGFQPRFATITDMHDCEACRVSWVNTFSSEEVAKAKEAIQLYKEAHHILHELDAQYQTHAIFRLVDANAEGDDLILDGVRFPLLRQQVFQEKEQTYLCLSDFIRPLSSGIKDKVGIFAATVDAVMETFSKNDDYKQLLIQTLADRLAEATIEKFHVDIRKFIWGYVPDETLSIKELHNEQFQGIRPAVGYPSLPDISVNFIINELLDMNQIGITLTENGMMRPHASVSGLMIAHPDARYFSVGKIGEDQLTDYARRRGMPIEQIRKFLVANL